MFKVGVIIAIIIAVVNVIIAILEYANTWRYNDED